MKYAIRTSITIGVEADTPEEAVRKGVDGLREAVLLAGFELRAPTEDDGGTGFVSEVDEAGEERDEEIAVFFGKKSHDGELLEPEIAPYGVSRLGRADEEADDGDESSGPGDSAGYIATD